MKTEVVMPKMGESLQEGTIIRWLKKPGDTIERDEMILEISTDKVDTEVPSPVAGIMYEILANENETVEVGKVIAIISSGEEAAPKISEVTSKEKTPVIETEIASEISTSKEFIIQTKQEEEKLPIEKRFYSPVVKSIAKEEGIDSDELEKIIGSGNDGRVTKNDILKYLDDKKKPSALAVKQPVEVVQKADSRISVKPAAMPILMDDNDEIIPMDRVRQLISEHMHYSKHTSAHVTSVSEADVTQIVRFRDKIKNSFESQNGFKLTFTPFFSNAAIDGIKNFPMVNVSVNGTNIIRHKRINLSIATALEDGNLIVPVIKNADMLNLSGLARAVNDLSTRARAKKLNPEEIQGGTFTLTNVGTFGTLFGTPIINQPQTAIMGIGAIKKRPVARLLDGEWVVVIRDMVYVSITYDHRVIDGMLAGQCLASIVHSLESMNEDTISI